jgi:hypothetical protein
VELQRLNRELGERLLAFTWEEWAQMGLLATANRHSRWAQDPEALIVFTLEIARGEPRLFDELLDWTLLNEPLLSVRRLRAMCIDDSDRALVNGTLGWLAVQRPRTRLTGGKPTPSPPTLEPLFRPAGPLGEIDPSFAAAGLARSPMQPSHKSRAPEPSSAINLAFRLRQILGVSIRAEVVRVLLGIAAPRVSTQVLARASGYSKRNVHDAVVGLSTAGVISAVTVNGEQRYAADRDAWAALLHCDPTELPVHRDWRELFAALRRILRFTAQPGLEDLSDYLIASRTRDLLEAIRSELAFAGIPTNISQAPEGAERDLEMIIERLLATLNMATGATSSSSSSSSS